MFRKTIDVFCQDRAKGINTVCTQCNFLKSDQVVLFIELYYWHSVELL